MGFCRCCGAHPPLFTRRRAFIHSNNLEPGRAHPRSKPNLVRGARFLHSLCAVDNTHLATSEVFRVAWAATDWRKCIEGKESAGQSLGYRHHEKNVLKRLSEAPPPALSAGIGPSASKLLVHAK